MILMIIAWVLPVIVIPGCAYIIARIDAHDQ